MWWGFVVHSWDHLICHMIRDNSYSCTDDFVYIRSSYQLYKLGIYISNKELKRTTVHYNWIGLRLGCQSLGQRNTDDRMDWFTDYWTLRAFYGYIFDSTDIFLILQVFLGVVFALPTTTADAIALPTRWPYSIVLTIVHINGTLSYPSTILITTNA